MQGLQRAILAVAILAGAGTARAEIGPDTLLIGVGETIGSGSTEIAAFGPGFGDLLIADILALRAAEPRFRDCDFALLEWRRRGQVLGERDLKLEGMIDPAAITVGDAPPPEPSVLIEGSLTDEGGMVSWTIEMRERVNDTVLATSTGSVPATEIAKQAARVARAMLEAACPTPGGWAASGGGARIVITGQVARIDVPFQLQGEFPGAAVAFEYTPTGALGGSVTYTFAGSGVSGGGEGEFTLAPQPDGTVLIEQTTNGCVNGIPNSCKTNSDKITLTPVSN